MPDISPRLGLPYLQPSQAQKHVTHNEALQRLDILTQLTLITMGATTPPAEPAAGDIHALGEAPLAAWAGQEGKLAFWDGAAWHFLTPQEGWRAFNLDGNVFQVFKSGAWSPEVPDLQNLDGVGVGTTSDATNRLSVASGATLLTHAGAGHQLKVNKATAGDTASLLFQSDWTGHAEMGLSGDTSFALKASADGSTWFEMLRADPAAQELALAPGATVKARLSDTALQLDVPVTGTAVQASANDTAQGRLLKVGAFGLGATAGLESIGSDFNVSLPTGFHRGGGSGGSNYPGVAAYGVTLAMRRYSTIDMRLSHNGAGDMWMSVHDGTGAPLSDPVQVYSQTSILGSVAQSGGVPTGAIIERGSNANGEYVKFADGTQVCTFARTVNHTTMASGSLHYSTDFGLWNFPANFSVAPILIANCTGTEQWANAGARLSGYMSNAILWSSVPLSAEPREITVLAIGRWF